MEKKRSDNSKTLWNPVFISVFICNIIFNLCAQMSNSLLSLYAKSVGAPADQIGQLVSMFALTALIFRFIAGPMMNAYNRKYLLMMAITLFGIAFLGYGFSPKIAELSGIDVILIMKAFRLLQGIGNAFGNACMLTIVSDSIPKERFSAGVGIFALALSVGQALGPSAGVILKDAIGFDNAYLVMSIVMFASCALVWLTVRIKNNGTGKMVLNLDNMVAKEALIPALLVFLISLGFTSINAFFLVYAEEKGIQGASYYFAVNASALMLTKPLIGKLNDRYGFVFVAFPSCILTALSLVLIGYSTSLWHLLAVALINSFGYGAAQPALQSMCMKCVPASKRGSASSTNYIAMDSATLLGPMICGYVAKATGYTPLMWITMAIPVAIASIAVLVFRKKLNTIEENFKKLA